MPMHIAVATLACVLLLAACGETRTTRVITGAAGGAVAGEVIADEPVAGAILGGTAGALLPR
jgi:osmotically inducible lipoprotein OsmB